MWPGSQKGESMIDRIGHFNIRTPKLEETLRFYEDLLELRRGDALTMTDQVNNAWLYDDSGRAVVHVNSTEPNEVVPEAGARSRVNHIAFDIRDLGTMEQRLKSRNVKYTRYDIGTVPGLTLLVTEDPNGIVLELAHGTDTCVNPAFVSAR